MKLYYYPIAPNPVKVLVYIGEKGLAIHKEIVDLGIQAQHEREHLSRNPLGTLPVLELDTGTHITESTAIVEYLEETHPSPPMLGNNAEERALIRSMERVIEYRILLPIVRIIHATNSPIGIPANPAIAESEYLKLPEGLSYIDKLIGSNEFVMGDSPTVADCTLYAAMNFANFGKLEIGTHHGNIHNWFKHFMLRDSTKNT